LGAGQTLTIAGLVFTAGSSGATASQLASAFANISNTATNSSINTAKSLGIDLGGTFTNGPFSGWSTGAASETTVTFKSSSVNADVTNLTIASPAGTEPAINVSEGSNVASTESALVSFSSMNAGASLSIADMTFTAGTLGASAIQVANAFGNLVTGMTANHANNVPLIYDSAYVVTPGPYTNTSSLSGYIDKPLDGKSYTFVATGSFTAPSANANSTIAKVTGTVTAIKIFVNGLLSEEIDYGGSVPTNMFGITSSTVSPPTQTILNTERSQAQLQYENLFKLIDTGASFTGSNITNGVMDQIKGGSGNDRFTGYGGDDYFNGMSGIDTVAYQGKFIDYILSSFRTTDRSDQTGLNQLSALLVRDGVQNRDNNDTLINVERLAFTDIGIAFDISSANSAGGIYRLYKAAFNREPDLGGLGYWINAADGGKGAVPMAEDFTWSTEFQLAYGVKITDNYATGANVQNLVNGFYKNVLGRNSDADGLNYYVGVIQSRDKTVGRVLAEISDSPENQQAVANAIANGIRYTPWTTQKTTGLELNDEPHEVFAEPQPLHNYQNSYQVNLIGPDYDPMHDWMWLG
jgi:hypothetical protein